MTCVIPHTKFKHGSVLYQNVVNYFSINHWKSKYKELPIESWSGLEPSNVLKGQKSDM